MILDFERLQEIWDSMYHEYIQINDNIILPDGIDQEFNMKMVEKNTRVREAIKNFSDIISGVKDSDRVIDELPKHLMEIHRCFSEWYELIEIMKDKKTPDEVEIVVDQPPVEDEKVEEEAEHESEETDWFK